MEWYGINLSGYRQRAWRKKSIRAISILLCVLLCALIMAFGIYMQSATLKRQNQQTLFEIERLEKQRVQLQQQIEHIKQLSFEQAAVAPFQQGEVTKILALLNLLPLDGGLTQLSIEPDAEPPNRLRIELSGTLSPEAFSRLEQQLKQQSQRYKIIQLQRDEQQRLEFHFIIEWEQDNVSMAK